MSTQLYFKSFCEQHKLSYKKANKVIDGRFKPYLSALDDQHYAGNDIWDAKTNAIQTYIKIFGVDYARRKINEL